MSRPGIAAIIISLAALGSAAWAATTALPANSTPPAIHAPVPDADLWPAAEKGRSAPGGAAREPGLGPRSGAAAREPGFGPRSGGAAGGAGFGPAPGWAARGSGWGRAPGSAAKSALGPDGVVRSSPYGPLPGQPGPRGWNQTYGQDGEQGGRRGGPPAPRPSTSGTPKVPAHLRVAQELTPDPVIIGDDAAYVLTVTNAGVTDATGVVATGLLDRDLTPGPLPDGCRLTGRTLTCGGPGMALPAGQSVTFELPVTTDPALRNGTNLAIRASVTAPDATPDEAELTTRARAVAEVEVRQEGAPKEVGHGEPIPYRLTVTNHGPSRAANVSLHHPADGGRATIAQRPAECPQTGPALTCPLGPLAPGESRTYAFSLTPHEAGPLTICASVTTGDGEENTADNHVCADTVVAAAPEPESTTEAEETPEPTPTATPEAERKDGKHEHAEQDEHRRERGRDTPAAAGEVPPPAHHEAGQLPVTGASVWMLGLGVAVLLAIGLLVRSFSHQDRRTS
ncbi:hypothetical protein ACFMQL_24770 [Nonomuraea fastidiosa]|uniref:hypothetical protein n=1 Tax=Nonomuraea fastidiosa TaxID=46173 RepID=UPI003672CC27